MLHCPVASGDRTMKPADFKTREGNSYTEKDVELLAELIAFNRFDMGVAISIGAAQLWIKSTDQLKDYIWMTPDEIENMSEHSERMLVRKLHQLVYEAYFSELPLLINQDGIEALVKWRLQIGK